MSRKMLINMAHQEECRIAIIKDKELLELELESNSGRKLKGNIYKAKIARIEPSLQAAFLDIGTERNGFLQINDVHPAYYKNQDKNEKGRRKKPTRSRRRKMEEVLSQGQELVVQVVKEEREMKGATLTTYLSLPGRYVVVMPGSDRGGISRKISDSQQRSHLRNLTSGLEIPKGMGMIVRTAGLDRSQSELSRDLSLQLTLWEKILSKAQSADCPSVLYRESDLAKRVIRDYFTPDIREIIIDDHKTYTRVKDFVTQVMPRYRSRIKLYEKEQPIFSHFHIDEQVSNTFEREVKLPSGGAIVIDSLEALVAIDVNSGKATTGGNIEETAYKTNLEAADEVARQLRLRDLGGLIVIDFIDMLDRKHRIEVEDRVSKAVVEDKARVEVGRLSKFGLLEMSRQRLRATLSSQSYRKCMSCKGLGKTKNPQFVALEVLRKIQGAVVVGHVSMIKARLATSAALFLLNYKQNELATLEHAHGVNIYVISDSRLRVDEFQFEIATHSQSEKQSAKQSEKGSQPTA